MRNTTFAIALLLVGCGQDAPRECGPTSGAYRMHFDEQSGDCGPQDDVLAPVDGPGAVPDGQPDPVTGEVCNRDLEVSSDQCSSMGIVVCQRTDGSTARGQSVLERYQGGALVTGTLDVTVTRAGAILCHSVYGVTARRL